LSHGIFPLPREERTRRQQAGREAKKRRGEAQAVRRALKRRSAAASELYAMTERMQDVLAQAHDAERDPVAREAYARAGRLYRSMRDEIVRAVLGGSDA
jgi:hypothetical protein